MNYDAMDHAECQDLIDDVVTVLMMNAGLNVSAADIVEMLRGSASHLEACIDE